MRDIKKERPGGQARALKHNYHDATRYIPPSGIGPPVLFGPLSRRDDHRGPRWALKINGDTITLTTDQLIVGPRGRRFKIKAFKELAIIVPPISRAEWEAIFRALLEALRDDK